MVISRFRVDRVKCRKDLKMSETGITGMGQVEINVNGKFDDLKIIWLRIEEIVHYGLTFE